MTTTETVEIRFLHHHTERTVKDGERKLTDYKPGDKATFPVNVARGLVAGRIAEYPTKKAAAAADAATA